VISTNFTFRNSNSADQTCRERITTCYRRIVLGRCRSGVTVNIEITDYTRQKDATRRIHSEGLERGSKKSTANGRAFAKLACNVAFQDTQTRGQSSWWVTTHHRVSVGWLTSRKICPRLLWLSVFRIVCLLKLPVGRQEVSVNYSGTG